MDPINPDDYEPRDGVVSYDDDLIGKYFFYNNKLVKVHRRQGGMKQVAVADIVTGETIGYPSAGSLIKAWRKPAINPLDYKPNANAVSNDDVIMVTIISTTIPDLSRYFIHNLVRRILHLQMR